MYILIYMVTFEVRRVRLLVICDHWWSAGCHLWFWSLL